MNETVETAYVLTTAERRRAVRWLARFEYRDIFDQATIDCLVFCRWSLCRRGITD